MITYVNTVFVSNNNSAALLTKAEMDGMNAQNVANYKGRFVMIDLDKDELNMYTVDKYTQRFKIGMITGKLMKNHKGESHPIIKWSNIILVHDIKSITAQTYRDDSEDTILIDFSAISPDTRALFLNAGKRIITRLTFKDMIGFRYRKWTESYEYVTKEGDTPNDIAAGIAILINKQWKRARVNANAQGAKLILTALPYDDDDAIETLNWAEKVRFNANVYFTDPSAEGWESVNKHFPQGLVITKTPGYRYAASAKLVRDREAQGMGYEGILNRGNGTWPIIKPEMETKLDGKYNALTLEFENMYRAADDIFRKTKQAVEIYTTSAVGSTISANIAAAVNAAKLGVSFDDDTQNTNIAANAQNIASNAQNIAALQSAMNTKANQAALNQLAARVTALENP